MNTDWSSQAQQEHAFIDSVVNGRLHHAWLLTGPEGIGKAAFAYRAATWLLAQEKPSHIAPDLYLGLGAPAKSHFADAAGGPAASLIEAGTHPEFHLLTRQTKERSDDLARNITVDQVRGLTQSLTGTPTIAQYRAVIIDALDDLERGAANALLKTLEEPRDDMVFFLISHAPGRLLPTLRSRCRQLRFPPFGADEMDRWLQANLPSLSADDRAIVALMSRGAPGRALELVDAGIGALAVEVNAILREGDRSNRLRAKLAKSLSLKAARRQYGALLDLAPLLGARHIETMPAEGRAAALSAWEQLRHIAERAEGQSYDMPMTVFEIGTLLARIGSVR